MTSIPLELFKGCTNLTSITLPSTITSISQSAFSETGLTSIDIPESVTSIDNYAFSGSNLTAVRLPSGIKEISQGTFSECEELTSVNLPAGITIIGTSAFQNCKKLSSITLPAGLNQLGDRAFLGSGLESIRIPAGIIQIEAYTFANCEKLAAIQVDNANPKYSSDGGVLFDKTKTMLIQYPGNKISDKYTIPSTVNTIGFRAFEYSTQLKHLVIPENVLAIKSFDYSGTGKFLMEDVTIEMENRIPLTLADGTFKNYMNGTYGLPIKTTLIVPDGTAALYRSTFQWECFEKIIEKSESANETVAATGQLRLYPNPVKEHLTVEHAGVLSGKPLVIYHMNGAVAARTVTGESVTRISVSHLPDGVYLICVDGKYTAKFMKAL